VPRTAITGPRRSRSATPLRALLVTGVLALSACGPAGTDGGSGTEKASGEFSFLGLSDNKVVATTLTSMSTTSCADANAASKLKADSVPQAQLDQKVQLLAGQGALPSMSVAAGTPDLVKEFISGGRLVNISAELEKSGRSDAILPAAADVIEKLYGQDAVYALPNELNIRSLGPDALRKVADGEAKLTDPEYLKAAEEVSALAKSGAFGPGVASTDYNGTINEFLTGKAAMLYMGSWALGNFNDPAQNKIGVDQIGFMPFPAVTGGAGSVDQVPANVGQPLVFSSEAFDAGSAAWLTCLAAHYGDTVLKEAGVVSGFKLSQQHDVSGLTAVVQEQINGAQSSVLWFEALFSAKATTVSQTNGGALGNGSVSGEEFMTKVQDALG
jgi:raffinose/stachyose/melibiose transport system substrate-binding protein